MGLLTMAALAACSPVGTAEAPTPTTTTTTTATTVRKAATTVAGVTATVADDGTALGHQLTDAERTVIDQAKPMTDRETAGRAVQLIHRRLADRRQLIEPTLAAVGPDVRSLVDNDLAASLAAADERAAYPPTGPAVLPAWHIREPRPAEELLGFYREAEAATGIEWTYLAAINLVETRLGRIEGTSTAGAQGPMQFLASTWADCCVGDVHDDHDAIVGAATYLRRRGGPDDMSRAILGYNPNSSYLEMVTRYAANLRADPRTFAGYHGWQVFFSTVDGSVRLPTGYLRAEPIDAAAYLVDHPEDRA